MAFSDRKNPAAVLDWAFDWSAWLDADETITSYTVTVATGLTKNSDSQADGVVTAWLSGGTDGEDYTVACQITTSAGRTDKKFFKAKVRNE